MKKRTRLTLLRAACVFWCFAVPLGAFANTQAHYQGDLQQFFEEISHEYAALELKTSAQGLSLASLRKKYASQLHQVQSDTDFHRLIQRLIAEFNDSHFSTKFDTDQLFYLGFTTDLIENDVVITSIDRKLLSKRQFPAEVGDTITHWNGQSIAFELAKIRPYIGKSSPQTANRYSAMLLPLREIQEIPQPLPVNEPVSLTLRSTSQNQSYQVSLPWKIGKSKDFAHPYCDQVDSKFSTPMGSVVIKPNIAYYHPHPDAPDVQVGYLRLSSFMVTSDQLEHQLKTDATLLNTLEQNTDILILDQTDNCGGNVEYAELLLSFFYDKSYTPVQYRFLATEKELEYWRGLGDKVGHITHTIQNALGKTKLTPLNSLLGQTEMPARPIYSHPILMLVNEFSGSAADVFPSYLKFSTRAKLMGHQTMGAGGHARPGFVLKHSKINVKIPRMLFYLPNGLALENHGAKPDYIYQETREDILYGFRPYQHDYLSKALALVSD